MMSDERNREDVDDWSTDGLIEVLEEDYRRCYKQIIERLDEGERDGNGHIHADTEFDSRQFIRAAFAYIEGVTFVLKLRALADAEEKGHELSVQQQFFIFEADFDLSDKGEVTQRPAKIRLTANIRFAFAIFAQANGINYRLDVGQEWWAKLKAAIKIRDRLTHPRFASDLDVAPYEVLDTIAAKMGFDEALHALANRKEM